MISEAFDLQNTRVYFYEIFGLHDDEDSVFLWITTPYNLVGGYENSEGTAFCLHPENINTYLT
jgi:hypothetical protein